MLKHNTQIFNIAEIFLYIQQNIVCELDHSGSQPFIYSYGFFCQITEEVIRAATKVADAINGARKA